MTSRHRGDCQAVFLFGEETTRCDCGDAQQSAALLRDRQTDPASAAAAREEVMDMSDHEHDWRADPNGYVYLSNPPAQKLVCATCGAEMFRYAELPAKPVDVKDWPDA